MEHGGVDANAPPPKRMRRPNVRLQQPYYDENPRRSKTQHLNSNSNQDQEIVKGSNMDDTAIGDWGSFDSDKVIRKKRVNKKRLTQRGGEEGNLVANNVDDENKEIGDSNGEDCNGGDGGGDDNLGFAKRGFETGENSSEMEGNDGDDPDNLDKGRERGQDSSEMERNDSGVREWLSELGLAKYAPLFEFNEVDDEVLPLLTLEDLKDMGITAVGSRRKMYTSIQKLRRSFS